MKRETGGFLVMWDDDQGLRLPLSLDFGGESADDQKLPEGGILGWDPPYFLFLSRTSAREAINRTHHYAKAFGDEDLPSKEFCKILLVQKELPEPREE